MIDTANITVTGKPIQTLTWAEKETRNQEWYKHNISYYIKNANFNFGNGKNDRKDLGMLYGVYNNKFPLNWFTHVTDPLSAKLPAHKAFPAKIRPVTILRTNLDLMMAEYPRRPFVYQVNNLGEGGYNNYTDSLNNKIHANIQEHFNQFFAEANGQPMVDDKGKPVNVPLPEKVQEEFHATYKDKIAIQGQRWMTRAMDEYYIRQKFGKMFKDWLIVGECYSYKGLESGSFIYEHINPMNFDYGMSEGNDMVEDAEWVVAKRNMTVADIVDRFYRDLKKDDILKLESDPTYRSPQAFYDFLSTSYNTSTIPVYHVQWKGRKMLKVVHGTDPLTGIPYETEVDEDYPVDPATETSEEFWPNEGYEGWQIGTNMFTRMQPIPVQRNEMNNCSKLKLSYNGRKFSDTNSENLSVLEIGLPFQIMYIIVTRTLELTIAKSKGKILLIDQNAIPDGDGWDEEKFFYYAEALGYGLLNRNQIGVDKSFNQYQVLDMTLFDNIKQLIELQESFKQQWDDVIGVNRQRKGQTYASDGMGVNERATFQSTIITDMIFNLFEEFTQKELTGILDFSNFINVDGVRAVWNSSELGTELLEIDPNTYCNAEKGIFLQSASQALGILNKIEGQVAAMIQNNVKPSTILEVLKSQNIAELSAKLKQIEKIEQEVTERTAANEADAAAQSDERKKKFMEYESLLEKDLMNATYDRKAEIQDSVNDTNTLTFQDGDSNDNGISDANEVEKRNIEREKMGKDERKADLDRMAKLQTDNAKILQKNNEINLKAQADERKDKIALRKIAADRRK